MSEQENDNVEVSEDDLIRMEVLLFSESLDFFTQRCGNKEKTRMC